MLPTATNAKASQVSARIAQQGSPRLNVSLESRASVELPKESARGQGLVIDRCHLTARTSGNQCALHGEPTALAISELDGSLQPDPSEKQSGPPASARVHVNPKARPASGPVSTDKPQQQKQPVKRSAPQATWPLVKQTLNEGSSYGDCEDILSPHLLSGRLSLSEQSEWTRRALLQVNSLSHQSNSNHKRPFSQPFERPSAGWIYNAIGAHKINMGQSLKGKLSRSVLAAISPFPLSHFHQVRRIQRRQRCQRCQRRASRASSHL